MSTQNDISDLSVTKDISKMNFWEHIRTEISNLKMSQAQNVIPLLVNNRPILFPNYKTLLGIYMIPTHGVYSLRYSRLYSTTTYTPAKMLERDEMKLFKQLYRRKHARDFKFNNNGEPEMYISGSYYCSAQGYDIKEPSMYAVSFKRHMVEFNSEITVLVQRDKEYEAVNVMTFDYFLATHYPNELARICGREEKVITQDVKNFDMESSIMNSIYYITHLPRLTYVYPKLYVAKELDNLIPLVVKTTGKSNILYDRLMDPNFKLPSNPLVSANEFDEFRKTLIPLKAPVAHNLRGLNVEGESNEIVFTTLYAFCKMAHVKITKYHIVKGSFILKYLLCSEFYGHIMYGSKEWEKQLTINKQRWTQDGLSVG